jgi:hypothetical protein
MLKNMTMQLWMPNYDFSKVHVKGGGGGLTTNKTAASAIGQEILGGVTVPVRSVIKLSFRNRYNKKLLFIRFRFRNTAFPGREPTNSRKQA